MKYRTMHRLSAFLLSAMMGIASALTAPLVKSGECPELKRAPMPFPEKYLNTSMPIVLKSFPNTKQVQLSPAQSINCTQTAPELEARLWADETGPGNPRFLQAMAFDERGRLWAAETFDYPNEVKDPFQGNDRIVILEDTDGDQVMDKHSVFVSGLNIPQGIEFLPQGILVAVAPHLVLFEDRNGDDRADSPTGRILYTGFRRNDTHGGVSNLRYGMDNWIYGTNGYNGANVKGVSMGSGIWRARPDGSRIEFHAPMGTNVWGLGFMEDGQAFGTVANVHHTNHAVIPGVQINNITTYASAIKPITMDIISGEIYGNFTAASTHEIYTARLFPKAYWNRASFIADGEANLVNQDFLESSGSTWKAVRKAAAPNLFATKDACTNPIATHVGPDGAVWVLDWYNYMFLHNGVDPRGLGNAMVHTERANTQCRIYRIAPSDGRLDPVLDLRNASMAQLVETFRHPNMFWRMTAQKLILKKAATPEQIGAVEILLKAAVKSRVRDELGLDPYALHALWTAEGLGLLESGAGAWDPILKDMLLHPAYAVRMNVLKAMPSTQASVQAIQDQGRVNDPDAYVRLQALLALGRMPKLPGIAILTAYRNLDRWSQQAFTRAAAGSGISETANLPVIPPLHPVQAVGLAWQDKARPSLRGILRLTYRGEGTWEPQPDGRLAPGELTVMTAGGQVVAKSGFDGFKWSSRLGGLTEALYFYAYRTEDARSYSGQLPFNPEP